MKKGPNKPQKTVGLGDLLLSFRRKMNDLIKKDFYGHDLTMPQMEVLTFVSNGRQSMEAIAGHLKIAPPSATALVAKMERRHLVVRKRDKSDRRMVYIELSPKVKKLVTSLVEKKDKLVKQWVSKLSSSDQKHLERIIGILISE